MTIKEKHELQEQVMAWHVMHAKRPAFWDMRRLCAFWMRQARKLNEQQLVQIAASLR